MKTAYLSIGSNLNNPLRQCRLAIEHIKRLDCCTLTRVAPFYFNPMQGRKKQPDYVNTVVQIKTRLTPQQLLKAMQSLEKKQGRVRRTRWGARTLDIDIILYDNISMRHPKLIIPHPRYLDRDFVMTPLRTLDIPGSVDSLKIPLPDDYDFQTSICHL